MGVARVQRAVISLLHVPVRMKRQLTLSHFVTGPTAAHDGLLGLEARTDSHPKRTKLTRGELTVPTGGCVNELGLEPDSGRRDLGRYSDESIRSMNNDDKFKLIEQAFRPGSNYKFPVQVEYGKKRSFQHCWLQSYSWLTYSEAMNGGFCIPCVFFAKGDRSSLGQLVNSPMTCLTRAKKTMEEHKVQECHVVATEDLYTFKRQMQKGELSVEKMIESEASANVKRNRLILESILKTLVFCGKQNIALRGHRDHGSIDLQGENQGNFRALLQFRVDAGDTILEEHFRTAGKNAQYISPKIQNDLLACIGQWIRDKILEEVREAKYFSVGADEAADVSNREQMPLIVRFVDKKGEIREEFLEFILCDEGVTGLAIANKITSTMQCETYDLDLKFLRGQAYDGAGNMAGKCQGAAARIQAIYPKALYFHCAAHILNLCVVGACKVQSVQNMMGVLKEISLFFSNSPKRQQELERQILEMTNSETNKKKLVELCRTRWIARIEAFEVFESLLSAVVNSLEVISEGARTGWNAESATMARGLFYSIKKFEFLITFVVVKRALGYTKGLTQLLQKRTLDICTAYREVDNVKLSLSQVRQNIDIVHKEWYQAAVMIGEKIHSPEPSLPRRCGSLNIMPGDSPEVYFRRLVTVPFIDELLNHLDNRFSISHTKAVCVMKSLMPASFMTSIGEMGSSTGELDIETVGLDKFEFYVEDLPSADELPQEMHNWVNKWRRFKGAFPLTPADCMSYADETMYPNINCVFRIFCTLPVTTAECERSVSVLRRLKTYMRSSMGQERLSSLALLQTNQSMAIDFDAVINSFSRKHPRRMILRDILSTVHT